MMVLNAEPPPLTGEIKSVNILETTVQAEPMSSILKNIHAMVIRMNMMRWYRKLGFLGDTCKLPWHNVT